MDTNPSHVELPLIPLIKETSTGKSDKDYFELKLCRYPTSIMSDLYEFRMTWFGCGKPEEFIFFVCNFNMTFEYTEILEMDAKVQYLRIPVHGEVLRQFYLFSVDVKNTDTSLTVDCLLKGLVCYFSL